MTVPQHIAFTGPLVALLVVSGMEWQFAILAAAASVFIDVDHVLDRILEQRRIAPLHEMVAAYTQDSIRKVYLLLHSLDLLIPALVLATMLQIKWLVAVLIGFSIHTISDVLYWCYWKKKVRPVIYFFIYRMSKRFEASRLIVRADDRQESLHEE
jgi:hypothetical protein